MYLLWDLFVILFFITIINRFILQNLVEHDKVHFLKRYGSVKVFRELFNAKFQREMMHFVYHIVTSYYKD